MKTQKWIGWVVALACVLALVVLWHYRRPTDDLRQDSVAALMDLHTALVGPDASPLLDRIALPQALANRTAAEQIEFLRKALRYEITPEGIELLKRKAAFGPLRDLFPEEADRWAAQGGVNVDDCVAFRLDRADAPRMEVVLAGTAAPDGRTPTVQAPFRVLRCNNVTDFAVLELSATETP